MDDKKIICKTPAKDFSEGFQLGNGRLGATVRGCTGHEIIEINEESVWSGCWTDRNNPDAQSGLKAARTLLSQERETEAQRCVWESFTGIPSEQNFYRSAGKLHIDFFDSEHAGSEGPFGERKDPFEKCDSYSRTLNLETGISTASFSIESEAPSAVGFTVDSSRTSVAYTRESFVEASSGVFVYHVSASNPKSIFMRVRLEKTGCCQKTCCTNDTIALFDTSGIPYAFMVTALASGGLVSIVGDNLIIEQADDVTLYADVETEFRSRHYRFKCGDVHKKPLSAAKRCGDMALKKICFAMGTSYDNLKNEHVADFTAAMSKTELTVAGNPELEEKWNLAKYRLITSSNENSLMPTVKNGIWHSDKEENSALRYEFADSSMNSLMGLRCGVEKIELPMFRFIRRLYGHGKKTASKMYGAQGFVAHNSSDIWADSVPCGCDLRTSYSPLGAARICKNIIDYFEWTLDRKFLKKNLKYILKACDFFASYLQDVDEKTRLVLTPAFTKGRKSNSEGKVFMTLENEEDTAAVSELFQAALKAMEYLDFDVAKDEFISCRRILDKLKFSSSKKIVAGDDFRSFGTNLLDSVISSTISKEYGNPRVEINLLPELFEGCGTGSLKAVCLRGNLMCDIEWENGELKNGRLYAKPDSPYLHDIAVIYKKHRYESRMSEESIDLKNILPTAI